MRSWRLRSEVVSIESRRKVDTPPNSPAATTGPPFSYTILRDLMTDKANEIKQSPSSRLQPNNRYYLMQLSARVASLVLLIFAGLGVARADNYDDTIAVFKKAGESTDFFRRRYAYAVV